VPPSSVVPGQRRPYVWVAGKLAKPATVVGLPSFCNKVNGDYYTFCPNALQTAYGISKIIGANGGAGMTIGIVDAYGDPNIQADLNEFCSLYGLTSPCSGVLTILYPQGIPGTVDSGWALETAADVEWAHALAPGATIILSVAASASITDLLGAVTAAVNAGATIISMSWGTPEFTGVNLYDSYFQAPGVTYVASSGDSGEQADPYEVDWPASSPYVVGVGGTTLYLNSGGNRIVPSGGQYSETAWSESGGGVSAIYSAQPFQSPWLASGTPASWKISNRTVPDVSYVADPNTGIGVVCTNPANSTMYLYEVGGTSIGAPQWAALFAVANQASNTSGLGNSAIYAAAGTAPNINSNNFTDITSGSDGSDPDDLAGPGYDLVTGLGSPVANGLVPALAPTPPTPDFSLSVTPNSKTVVRGNAATYTVTVGSINGFSNPVNLSVVNGLPTSASASYSGNPVTPGSSGSVMISTSSTTPAGTYPITIGGTSGTLSHQITATLVVTTGANPDFSISVNPSSQSISRRGGSTTYTVTVTPLNGFTGSVSLTATGLPGSIFGSFSANPITITNGSGASTLTLLAWLTKTGTYTGKITGTSGSIAHSATYKLTITP